MALIKLAPNIQLQGPFSQVESLLFLFIVVGSTINEDWQSLDLARPCLTHSFTSFSPIYMLSSY